MSNGHDFHPAFEEIQEDPDVCSNCFRRKRDRYERNFRLEPYRREDGEWDVRPVQVSGIEITLPSGETEVIGGYDDAVSRRPANTTKIPGRGSPRGMITVCKCGFRWAPEEVLDQWKNRPLPKRKFFEYAEHLKDRLEEDGVGYDEDTFDVALDELKSNPDEQFADDRIYSKALKIATTSSLVSL